MNIITPSQAIQKLQGFLERMNRLRSYSHSDPKFRVADLRKLKNERPKLNLLCSIAIHNKNKERAHLIISDVRDQFKWLTLESDTIYWKWDSNASDGDEFIKGCDFWGNKYAALGKNFNSDGHENPFVYLGSVELI